MILVYNKVIYNLKLFGMKNIYKVFKIDLINRDYTTPNISIK